jgi:hypothetical protein
MEATAIQFMLAGKSFKTLAAPSGTLVETDLSASFGGRLPVFLPNYLNVKYVVWNSRV